MDICAATDRLSWLGVRDDFLAGNGGLISRTSYPPAFPQDLGAVLHAVSRGLSEITAGRSAGVVMSSASAGTVTTATVLPVMSKNSTE
jgi:hypothetical protein